MNCGNAQGKCAISNLCFTVYFKKNQNRMLHITSKRKRQLEQSNNNLTLRGSFIPSHFYRPAPPPRIEQQRDCSSSRVSRYSRKRPHSSTFHHSPKNTGGIFSDLEEESRIFCNQKIKFQFDRGWKANSTPVSPKAIKLEGEFRRKGSMVLGSRVSG